MKKRPKEQSACVILEELKKDEGMTKVELASRLQLSFATISNLCKVLEEKGYILSKEGSVSTGGRRPNKICLNSTFGCFAILTFSYPTDVFKLELVDFSFKKINAKLVMYDNILSIESLMDTIQHEMLEALEECGKKKKDLLGICFSIPGVFDKKRDTTFTKNKKLINNIRLRERVRKMFSTTVVIENDANLVALGYASKMNSRIRNMLMLFFTHGVGLGILCDGEIFRGRSGYAGEIGHIRSSESEKRCESCGAMGCLETVVTLRYILFDFYEGKYSMQEILKRQDYFFAELLKSQRNGDPHAGRVIARAGRAIGDLLGSLTDLFNPEIIGLCGDNIPLIRECLETINLSMRERSFIIDDNDTPLMIMENYEELMTLGATEMIFSEWLRSNQLIGDK